MKLLNALIAFFIIFNLNAKAPQGHPHGTKPLVPAAIVFGDSIMDPGNNNAIRTFLKANFPPYGVNLPGHEPSGRFCNGKIATDFLASKLKIKEYMPAYIGTKLSPEDLLTGVSFASGGAGFDPLTSKLASVISLDQQLELFKEYKEKLRSIAGDERAAHIISESLYVICAGSDDVANNYFTAPFRKAMYDIPSYAEFLAGHSSNFVQELLHLGARKIGVVSIPPIGCVPAQRTLEGGILRFCDFNQNLMASLFNSRMDKVLQSLKVKFPEALLVLADIYGILYDIIQRPNNYGFEISTKGCCGTGKLEVSFLCNSLTSSICSNVSKYVFWDSFHPTEKAYKVLIDYLYKEYIHLLI